MCNRPPERVDLEVVGEAASAVDLDDRDQLSVARLEARVPVDHDLVELEAELAAELDELSLRALTQVAACRLVENDSGIATGRAHG